MSRAFFGESTVDEALLAIYPSFVGVQSLETEKDHVKLVQLEAFAFRAPFRQLIQPGLKTDDLSGLGIGPRWPSHFGKSE